MGAVGSFLGKRDPALHAVDTLKNEYGHHGEEEILDTLDMVYKIIHPRFGNGKLTQIHYCKLGGCEAIQHTVDRHPENELILRASVRALLPLAQNHHLAEALRENQTRTYLENLIDMNKLDDVLQREGKEALDCINKVGAEMAAEQILAAVDMNDPGGLMSVMRNHPRKRQTNEDAIMELLEMSKQGEGMIHDMVQLELLPLLQLTMRRFHQSASVQTKCLAVITSTAQNITACSLWGKQGVIELAIGTYHRFENNFGVQQQVLWACAELAKVPSNVERLERDGLKQILRPLSKEEKKRKETRKKEPQNIMLWRLVPSRLKLLWTTQQLLTEYVPTQPGEEDDPEQQQEPTHYDLKVQKHGYYHEAKWKQQVDLSEDFAERHPYGVCSDPALTDELSSHKGKYTENEKKAYAKATAEEKYAMKF